MLRSCKRTSTYHSAIVYRCRSQAPPARAAIPAHVITSLMKECDSWRQVRQIVLQYSRQLDAIHVSAAFVRVAKLHAAAAHAANTVPWPRASNNSPTRGPLLASLAGSTAVAGAPAGPPARLSASFARMPAAAQPARCACGRCDACFEAAALAQFLDALCDAALAHLPACEPRQVANILWALATLSGKGLKGG